jgi:hypothetical protein
MMRAPERIAGLLGLPVASGNTTKPEAVIGIVGSTDHHFRVLTVFRRVKSGR